MRASGRNILLCGLLGACTVGNTGNPNKGSDSPEGIVLLRSALTRDPSPDVTSEELRSFAADQQAFALDLYRELGKDDANLLFSPYSIASALAMTYAGAAGSTKTEMATALHLNLPDPKLHAAFNAVELDLARRPQELSETTKSGDGFQLSTNNASFAQRGLAVHSEFLDVLATNYDAGLFLADFEREPERERKAINSWVLDRTERRIEEILPSGSIDQNTRLVLVNTIYFKGSWQTKFDPEQTKSETFHAAGGDVSVPMMHGGATAGFKRGDGYLAVDRPYLSESVHMLLVLPDAGQQAAVEARLQSGLFAEARGAALDPYTVDLRLPRFSFRTTFALRPVLSSLGMASAFSDSADFSSIAGVPGDLFIDEVYHQAFVAVDEQGTEAAGATAVVIVTRSAAPQPVSVTFDRPFLFFIYDDPTGQILFAGRVNKP